ncbi:MAG: HAD-IA family hydrolase [Cellvibrionaceae bacterium]
MFKAFLFDLDDTLVNTSHIVYLSMKKWCAENNVNLELAIEKGKGTRIEDTLALVAPHLDALEEAKKIEKYEEHLIGSLKPVSGAKEFLLKLPVESWAIVTSSSHQLAERKLKVNDLPNPKLLITADCVKAGKPNPEPYLKAIQKLGLSPEECLIFEDADSGIISATAAGCNVVVVGSNSTIENKSIVAKIQTFNELNLSISDGLSIEPFC